MYEQPEVMLNEITRTDNDSMDTNQDYEKLDDYNQCYEEIQSPQAYEEFQRAPQPPPPRQHQQLQLQHLSSADAYEFSKCPAYVTSAHQSETEFTQCPAYIPTQPKGLFSLQPSSNGESGELIDQITQSRQLTESDQRTQSDEMYVNYTITDK